MASQESLEKMQLRQNYRNLWHTDLMNTIKADFPCMFAVCRFGVGHVYPTCSGKELFTMICQGIHVALAISPAVEGVVKVNALSFALLLRVCACMQTQHKVELDKRDGKFGPPGVMAVPPVQQMSRIDQPIPPPAYGAPPPAYGQPYGYPPPQAQAPGYPPPGYPAQPQAYPPPGYYPK
ncbi:hypothetical protein FCM35_KLT16116 [Carex littledalei]|uniref:PLAC8 family protein n=1 Tax=Carex littledalei TaxID=544730 RepID=A0A833R8N1_9POAL|nr:hypothetical protein FCM35_KLT16116 [Carex littledalei]